MGNSCTTACATANGSRLSFRSSAQRRALALSFAIRIWRADLKLSVVDVRAVASEVNVLVFMYGFF